MGSLSLVQRVGKKGKENGKGKTCGGAPASVVPVRGCRCISGRRGCVWEAGPGHGGYPRMPARGVEEMLDGGEQPSLGDKVN